MDDIRKLAAFEAGTLHPFHHRDHIHIAWLYLRRDGWEAGYRQIRDGIQHFAVVNGHATLYHETITQFWARVILHAIEARPEIDDFDAFTEAFPFLLDKTSIKQHYSADVLRSDVARHEWQEPDLIPMPA
jgi:hypothetical protein